MGIGKKKTMKSETVLRIPPARRFADSFMQCCSENVKVQ